jgi:periplasmic protein TonB
MSELALIDRRPSRRLWLLAAAGALALHLGGVAFAVARLSSDDEGDALGANAVEVGVEWASPHVEDTDLPPGPDSDASVASPPMPDQTAEAKPTDLPQDTPDKTDDPDRVVTENKSAKPTEEDPKIETVQTTASPESVQRVATAQQTLENAREAATTTAPNIGMGKDKQQLTADWGRKISAYFELHKRYPEIEKGRNARVKVSLVLNRLGHVLSVAVAESSGDAVFDEAAVSMIHRSDPVPRPPAKLTDDQFNFSLDVNFTKPK